MANLAYTPLQLATCACVSGNTLKQSLIFLLNAKSQNDLWNYTHPLILTAEPRVCALWTPIGTIEWIITGPYTHRIISPELKYTRVALEPKRLSLINRPVGVSANDEDSQLCNDPNDGAGLLEVWL
jgi:hypothetical protein